MRYLLGLLSFLLPVAAFSQSPPFIPIADFASLPALGSPQVSPGGNRIAALATVGGQRRLVLIDPANPSGRPRQIGVGDAVVADLHWAGNERILLEVLSTSSLGGVELPVLRLIIIDINSGQSRVGDPKSRGIFGGDVLYADPTGTYALVSSQDNLFAWPSVKRVDLATGAATVVEKAKNDVWDWFVDGQGDVRGGVAYDEKRWRLYYRDRAGEAFRTLRGKFAKSEDSSVDRFVFGRDGQTGMIVTNERTGRFALYEYDFRAGEVGKIVFESPVADISETLVDPSNFQLAGVRYHEERWKTHWIDPKMKALQARLDKALPGLDNLVLRHPGTNRHVLIWSSGASDPGTYYLLDQQTSSMRPVVQPYDRIDPGVLAPVKAVQYAARDGLTIPAYLTLPRGRDPRALPLILLPHGGPFARDEWTYDVLVQFLANRGYAVLQPQFRGSTGYGKDFVARGHGEWGRKMQDDLDDGVDWLARSGQVDPKRVCIVGGSYGGYAALWGAVRNPERYRCAASVAGVTDLDQQLRQNRKSFSATRYFRQWRTKVQGEGKFDLKTVSPLAHAASIRVPVLIAHGEKDKTVLATQSHQMVAALQAAKADVTSVFYKEGGHDFSSSTDLADFLRRLEAFVGKHNPAAAPAR